MRPAAELSEAEFRMMQDIALERFGISFPQAKRSYFQMKLAPRLVTLGMRSYREYIDFVKNGRGENRELRRMMELLTNHETYFFRESPKLWAFRDHVLPEIRQKKVAAGKRRLRVLSAGCSSGEEVYSLAILIFESGSFFWDWDVRVIGMDLSEKALSTARMGIYSERSFKASESRYAMSYFVPGPNGYQVKNSIRQLVRFEYGNIADDACWQDMEPLDVIFCRNVLIYFSDEQLRRAIGKFHDALAPGGALFLGHSESLAGVPSGFVTDRYPGYIVYRKPE